MTKPIKISSLQARYHLNSRQAVNNRINGLKIEPIARGEISPEQLALLDRLDDHIRAGGAIADFPTQPEVQEMALLDKHTIESDNSGFTPNTEEGMSTINVMVSLMEKLMAYAYAPQISFISTYEQLEKVVLNEWILPTSQIRNLIGTTPKTSSGKDFFTLGSFTFIKTGKIGHQTGWQVVKTEVPPELPSWSTRLTQAK